MSDNFTSNVVDNDPVQIAGVDFHHGPMDFSVQYGVPNKVDSTLDFNTTYPSVAVSKRGKNPIIAKTVVTEDIPTSDVIEDWETRNDKAVTNTKGKGVTINFDIAAGADLLGKVVGDLQKNVAESAKSVIGTLKYVEEYTGFSSDPKQQQGNFLAFKVACDLPFTNITAKKGDDVEKSYDPSDSTFIYIMDKHYPITVKAYDGDKCVSMRTYSTDQLVFEPAEN